MPQHDLESNTPSNPSTGYNAQAYLKAGLVFVTTTATFLLAKTTGFLPNWLWSSKAEQPDNQLGLMTTNNENMLVTSDAGVMTQVVDPAFLLPSFAPLISASDEPIDFAELKPTDAAKEENVVELDTDQGIKISPMQRKLLSQTTSPTQFPAVVELSSLNGQIGVIFNGEVPYDNSGSSVNLAGDINGDGISDLIITSTTGKSYLVFGTNSTWNSSFELSSLTGSNGVIFNGEAGSDARGVSANAAGDVNGDGIADLLIGACEASPNGKTQAGKSYLVFGKRGTWNSPFNLSSLIGSNGVVFNGEANNDYSGRSVSPTGDVNGDGISDLIIGAYGATPNGRAIALEFNR